MPEAILKFTLPEERNEFELAFSAQKMYAVIWDFKEWLRNQLKHNPDNLSEKECELLEKVSDKFYDFINEYEVSSDL